VPARAVTAVTACDAGPNLAREQLHQADDTLASVARRVRDPHNERCALRRWRSAVELLQPELLEKRLDLDLEFRRVAERLVAADAHLAAHACQVRPHADTDERAARQHTPRPVFV